MQCRVVAELELELALELAEVGIQKLMCISVQDLT